MTLHHQLGKSGEELAKAFLVSKKDVTYAEASWEEVRGMSFLP